MYPSILFLLMPLLLTEARADLLSGIYRTDCGASKEFVTLHAYLKKDQDDRVQEPDAVELAKTAVKGCSGAAHRFIRVSKTLGIAGVNRKNRMALAIAFALRDEASTEAFITVFRSASASDVLDLDLDASLQLAKSLSVEFKGDPSKARKDFERILKWCSDATRSGLIRRDCGRFSVEIARTGEGWKDSVAQPWIELFDYLTSSSGPGLTTAEARDLAKRLSLYGPDALKNFSVAYEYALSSKGLAFTRDQSIELATTLVGLSPSGAIKSGETGTRPVTQNARTGQ
jgi:hypothetical protein